MLTTVHYFFFPSIYETECSEFLTALLEKWAQCLAPGCLGEPESRDSPKRGQCAR